MQNHVTSIQCPISDTAPRQPRYCIFFAILCYH